MSATRRFLALLMKPYFEFEDLCQLRLWGGIILPQDTVERKLLHTGPQPRLRAKCHHKACLVLSISKTSNHSPGPATAIAHQEPSVDDAPAMGRSMNSLEITVGKTKPHNRVSKGQMMNTCSSGYFGFIFPGTPPRPTAARQNPALLPAAAGVGRQPRFGARRAGDSSNRHPPV